MRNTFFLEQPSNWWSLSTLLGWVEFSGPKKVGFEDVLILGFSPHRTIRHNSSLPYFGIPILTLFRASIHMSWELIKHFRLGKIEKKKKWRCLKRKQNFSTHSTSISNNHRQVNYDVSLLFNYTQVV